MAASAVYKIQPRVAGSWRAGQVHVKVAGKWYNPRAVYIKVSGHWRMTYQRFTWYYYWDVGAWSGCSCIGWCSSRAVWCKFNPEGKIVADSYCDPATRPAATQICNCNCACACCCC